MHLTDIVYIYDIRQTLLHIYKNDHTKTVVCHLFLHVETMWHLGVHNILFFLHFHTHIPKPKCLGKHVPLENEVKVLHFKELAQTETILY